jgi:hypothetical protein
MFIQVEAVDVLAHESRVFWLLPVFLVVEEGKHQVLKPRATSPDLYDRDFVVL